jgi:hypothetical protein
MNLNFEKFKVQVFKRGEERGVTGFKVKKARS